MFLPLCRVLKLPKSFCKFATLSIGRMDFIENIELSGDSLCRIPVVAGPCSAESSEQCMATAKALAALGVRAFRAGLWKPRTKPNCFEGVGAEGLAWLTAVRRETGMAVMSEVATPVHVEEALSAGLDALWIGARTTTNPFAVQEIADALRGVEIPVFVKNPVTPDLALWIGAIERLSNAGVKEIAAVHRGFADYANGRYRNNPQWTIPIDLRREMPAIPILCDPSHIGGRREAVEPLCRQAVDLGFDGLFVEAHIAPDEALSDSRQQITPQMLGAILGRLVLRDGATTEGQMIRFRSEIDAIDAALLDLLARRMEVSRQIGRYKRSRNVAVLQSGRYAEVVARFVEGAKSAGMDEQFIKKIVGAIHEESVRQQLEKEE